MKQNLSKISDTVITDPMIDLVVHSDSEFTTVTGKTQIKKAKRAHHRLMGKERAMEMEVAQRDIGHKRQPNR